MDSNQQSALDFLTCEIDGAFPNYRQVLLDPTKFATTLELEPENLPNIITMIGQMPCHDETNQTIGIEVKDGDVTLLGRAPGAENWTRLGIQSLVKGRDVTIYLNRTFLTQALRFGLTKIELIDAMSPLRLSQGGQQVIIMPVRVDATTPVHNEQAETPTKKETMNSTTETSESTSTDKIEESLEVIENLKVTFQDTLTSLKDLGGKLKQIQRERKIGERELQGIRNSIRSLQTIRV